MRTYSLGCKVTRQEAIISGKRHVLVIKANGMKFYMDEFFLGVMENLGDASALKSTRDKYDVPNEYIERAVQTLLMGGFVQPAERDVTEQQETEALASPERKGNCGIWRP